MTVSEPELKNMAKGACPEESRVDATVLLTSSPTVPSEPGAEQTEFSGCRFLGSCTEHLKMGPITQLSPHTPGLRLGNLQLSTSQMSETLTAVHGGAAGRVMLHTDSDGWPSREAEELAWPQCYCVPTSACRVLQQLQPRGEAQAADCTHPAHMERGPGSLLHPEGRGPVTLT